MKTFMLIFVHFASAVLLFAGSCGHKPANPKVQGNWRTKDGATKLRITADKFIEDAGAPVAEDYFMKGDTIYTTYQGNQPYTKFVVQKLDEHNLNLLYPDSVKMEFIK